MINSTKPTISIVIPVRNGAATLGDCLRALRGQSLSATYEIIVVDDGSTDDSAEVSLRAGIAPIRQAGLGAPAARNAGIAAARGQWVAFTDADCVPSRRWLKSLLDAVAPEGENAMGAAGPLHGLHSRSSAARFVDLSGGLDAERHLSHPHYPFAPSGNVMYRSDLLRKIGGFDGRFATYDACDLHARLTRRFPMRFSYAPAAVVMHRHRPTWRAYFRQQLGYGRGYAQFMLRYRDEIQWPVTRELIEWTSLLAAAIRAVLQMRGTQGILARGKFIRGLAQRLGFVRTYWSTRERQRWDTPC